MKKIFVIIVFILNFCLLFACADATYIVEYKENGEITQTFSVFLDKQKIDENGYNYFDISTYIYNLYSNYWNNKFLSMQHNLENNQEIKQEEVDEILSSIKKEIEVSETKIAIIITYPNSKIANLVNTDTTEQEEDDDKVKYIENALTTTMVQNITNIFNGYHESELYSTLNSLFNQNGEFNDEDLSLKHIIAFSNKRYKSNANSTVFENGLYYHIWNINSTPDKNNQYATTNMEIYVTTARPIMWYILASVATLLFVVFSFVYVRYSKIKQNKLK